MAFEVDLSFQTTQYTTIVIDSPSIETKEEAEQEALDIIQTQYRDGMNVSVEEVREITR